MCGIFMMIIRYFFPIWCKMQINIVNAQHDIIQIYNKFCGTDSILWSIPSFRLNLGNIPHNNVSLIEHSLWIWRMLWMLTFMFLNTYLRFKTYPITLQRRATAHKRLRACDHYTSSALIGGKGGPVQVRFTPRLRDQRSVWMHDGCKVYMDSYMVSNGPCFMVTWIIFKTHPLEVGLRQSQEIMAAWTLTTVDLLYYIMWEDPHE